MAIVSILIPAYNAEKYIAGTIKSVINQLFTEWELLVLDDCSKDNTFLVAHATANNDARITVIKNEQNLGMSSNWNKGIGLCTNKYFVKLDADDLWHPNFLKKSIEVMEADPEIGMLFCKTIDIDENGIIIDGSEVILPDFVRNKKFSCVPLVQLGSMQMLRYPILRQGISLIRRNIITEIGGYLSIRSADTEFYFRVGCHYNLSYIDQTLYFYRMHNNSDSQAIENENKREIYLYEATELILKYYFAHQKISISQYKKFSDDNFFRYATCRINSLRKNNKISKFVFLLVKIFLQFPIYSLSFYINRFRVKFKRRSNKEVVDFGLEILK